MSENFPTRFDPNWHAQLHSGAKRLETLDIHVDFEGHFYTVKNRATKTLIRICGCLG